MVRPPEKKDPGLIHLYIEKEVKKKLQEYAKKKGISISKLVEDMVFRMLKGEKAYLGEVERLKAENRKLKNELENLRKKTLGVTPKIAKEEKILEELKQYTGQKFIDIMTELGFNEDGAWKFLHKNFIYNKKPPTWLLNKKYRVSIRIVKNKPHIEGIITSWEEYLEEEGGDSP